MVYVSIYAFEVHILKALYGLEYMLDIPQQIPLKYGFSGIEILALHLVHIENICRILLCCSCIPFKSLFLDNVQSCSTKYWWEKTLAVVRQKILSIDPPEVSTAKV